MPLYDFRCAACGATRELHGSYTEISALTLICTACGGAMTKAPSRIGGVVVRSLTSPSPSKSGAPKGQHDHDACRASVRLSRPNPFEAQLGAQKQAEKVKES